MKITFTETESSERSYFEQTPDDHELNFVPAARQSRCWLRH